jgi:hypothetical protein
MLLIVCFLAPAVFGQDNSPFDTWDKNRDGRLAKDELPPNAQSNFEKADTDGNGFLSRKEDAAFRPHNPNLADQTGRARAQPQIDIQSDLAYAATGNPRQKLDLFLPKKRATDEPLPLSLSFMEAVGETVTNAAGSVAWRHSSNPVSSWEHLLAIV